MKALPTVADFMDTVVPTLNPETRIIEAVDFLLHHRVTGAPVVDAGSAASCWPVEASQILIVVSDEPEASRVPSGLNATEVTSPS